MKPASAMSFALRKPGRSALVCASTGTDFAVDAVIAAKAAERRRSRLVNISAPLLFWSVLLLLPDLALLPGLACRRYAPSWRLTMENRATPSPSRCPPHKTDMRSRPHEGRS